MWWGEFKFLNGINCIILFLNVMLLLCLKVKFIQMIKLRRKLRVLVNSCDNQFIYLNIEYINCFIIYEYIFLCDLK